MKRVVKNIQSSDVENPIYSIVIPIRDRCEHMLRNCLRSVELQTLEPVETIIVDFGSTHENHLKILDIAKGCTVYRYQTKEPWNLSRARNIGLRRAKAEHSGVLDCDLILEPRVFELTHQIHEAYTRCYITTKVILLSPNAISPSQIQLPEAYPLLRKAPYLKRAEGWGGFTSSPKSWWFECRGFDERMTWWGWEDVDMWKRVARGKLNRCRLQKIKQGSHEIYHQYHTNAQTAALQQKNMPIFEAIMLNEDYAKHTQGIIRNDENWGRWSED